jgi:CO/xanthine dehydrogenase FAD-binding subunit
MKPPAFHYVRPSNVGAALAALSTYRDQAKILAGGQSLVPMLNLRLVAPQHVIDISRLAELQYINLTGAELRIGALTTHNTVLRSATVATHCPILVEAYGHVAHNTVRNHGTIGGSLCHNDPAAEMPLVASLLGASLVLRSATGERVVAADAFIGGAFETAARPDELLVEVRYPIPAAGHGWAFDEVNQRHGDFALVAAGCMLSLDKGVCRNVRLGYRNVGAGILRIAAAEAALEGKAPTLALYAAAAKIAVQHVNPSEDVHADKEYRRDLVLALTERVLATAVGRCKS